jgi:hypothetical protein
MKILQLNLPPTNPKDTPMNLYLGTKLIQAKPMTRKEYNDFRNWELPSDEDGSDAGYLVEYMDGGTANTKTHQGYVSWSPEETFNKAYKTNGSFNFGHALALLNAGFRVSRSGWNGKDMYVYKVDGSTFNANRPPLTNHLTKGTQVVYRPHLDMRYADGTFGVWLASQSDMLAEDWVVLE